MDSIPHNSSSMVDFEILTRIVFFNRTDDRYELTVRFKADGTIQPPFQGWNHWRVECGCIVAYNPTGMEQVLSRPLVVEAYREALARRVNSFITEE